MLRGEQLIESLEEAIDCLSDDMCESAAGGDLLWAQTARDMIRGIQYFADVNELKLQVSIPWIRNLIN